MTLGHRGPTLLLSVLADQAPLAVPVGMAVACVQVIVHIQAGGVHLQAGVQTRQGPQVADRTAAASILDSLPALAVSIGGDLPTDSVPASR